MYQIIDKVEYLTEPLIPSLGEPTIEHQLASLVECMRLILFIFILTISVTLPQLTGSTLGLILEVASNFEQHFVRMVPILFNA